MNTNSRDKISKEMFEDHNCQAEADIISALLQMFVIPERNEEGFEIDWQGKHSQCLRHAFDMALNRSPDFYNRHEAGRRIILAFPTELQRAGWWPVGQMYLTIVRLLGIGPNGSSNKPEPKWLVEYVKDAAIRKMPRLLQWEASYARDILLLTEKVSSKRRGLSNEEGSWPNTHARPWYGERI